MRHVAVDDDPAQGVRVRRLGRSGVERRQWAAHWAFMPLPGFQDAALDPTRTEIGNVVETALLSGRASRECPHPGAGRRPPRPVNRTQGFVIAAEVPVNAGSTGYRASTPCSTGHAAIISAHLSWATKRTKSGSGHSACGNWDSARSHDWLRKSAYAALFSRPDSWGSSGGGVWPRRRPSRNIRERRPGL